MDHVNRDTYGTQGLYAGTRPVSAHFTLETRHRATLYQYLTLLSLQGPRFLDLRLARFSFAGEAHFHGEDTLRLF